MEIHGAGKTTRRQIVAGSVSAAALFAFARPAMAAYVVRPWPAGKPAPALLLSDLDGKDWSLAALAGRPVMLNFWATWCEPCRAEMPSLSLLARQHDKAGLAVLSVNYQEVPATIRNFVGALPFSLPVLLDRDGDAAAAWTPRVFPTTVLIDRRGAPRASVIGGLDWAGAAGRALVDPLLATSRTA